MLRRRFGGALDFGPLGGDRVLARGEGLVAGAGGRSLAAATLGMPQV